VGLQINVSERVVSKLQIQAMWKTSENEKRPHTVVEVEDEVKSGRDSRQTVSMWEKLLPMPRSTYKNVQVNVWEKINLLTGTGDLMGDGCWTGETQYWGAKINK
jgi:hypothetical protein